MQELKLIIDAELEALKTEIKLLKNELEVSKKRTENLEKELKLLKESKCEISSPPVPPPAPKYPLFVYVPQNNSRLRSNSDSRDSNKDVQNYQQNTLKPEKRNKLYSSVPALDSVIADIKSGNVTLKRRPKSFNPPKVIVDDYSDICSQQNQNHKITIKILDNELSNIFKKFNINV